MCLSLAEGVLHLGNSQGSFDSSRPPLLSHVAAEMLNLLSVLLPILLVAVASLDSLSVVGDLELVIPLRRLGTLCRKAVQGLCFQRMHCREEALHVVSTEELPALLGQQQCTLDASSLPRLPTPVPHVQHSVG